jgi:hypothetical protein
MRVPPSIPDLTLSEFVLGDAERDGPHPALIDAGYSSTVSTPPARSSLRPPALSARRRVRTSIATP